MKISNTKNVSDYLGTRITERDERHAGAPVPDQQMRLRPPIYPVDRYLVESSNKIEMVNINDDDLWQVEPALRPEDEIILRKLHDMLQSTADDLKLLSGELAKFHEPRVQVKTQPFPLDEEFNEKIHIEEIVNAKFHGYKIVEPSAPPSSFRSTDGVKISTPNFSKTSTKAALDSVESCPQKRPRNSGLNKNLTMTRPKIITIEEKRNNVKQTKEQISKVKSKPVVNFNEFSYKYVEPEEVPKPSVQNKFTIQDMPRINIRSELTQQKVLQLDIIPDSEEIKDISSNKKNVAVVSVEHSVPNPKIQPPSVTNVKYNVNATTNRSKTIPTFSKTLPVRKVSKLSTYESSESTNNVSSDTLHTAKIKKIAKAVLRTSPRHSSTRLDRAKGKKATVSKKEPERRSHPKADEWKKKLNAVYGQPSTSRLSRTAYRSKARTVSPKKSNLTPRDFVSQRPLLNNREYIPYSKLTLGGVRVSDIEREISQIPNKKDMPLSPILDKILSSRDNTPRKSKEQSAKKEKIFTTSDENLLEEVLDLERTVSKTLSKGQNINKLHADTQETTKEKESDSKESYADDFEDEKTDNTEPNDSRPPSTRSHSEPEHAVSNDDTRSDPDNQNIDKSSPNKQNSNVNNKTFTKATNLSFKNSVDVFEFIHSLETHESGTQSNTTHKISLKETQTTPRDESPRIQPIHNDLWCPIDPKGEVEKMFELEKDFIKKIIIEEYGDLLEKNVSRPSTSKDLNEENKTIAYQKNTQTSPAHAKSVMTSPTRTKTRTTSPFLSLRVDHQTSPMSSIEVNKEPELTLEITNEEDSISINLSSPRFSLRLPQTSREIICNLEEFSNPNKTERKTSATKSKTNATKSKTSAIKSNTFRKVKNVSSSSSLDGDDSSELSSLGEVKLKLKKLKKRVATISESSSTSTISKYSSDFNSVGILPLRSEGEVSLGQVGRGVLKKNNRSEGETSIGRAK